MAALGKVHGALNVVEEGLLEAPGSEELNELKVEMELVKESYVHNFYFFYHNDYFLFFNLEKILWKGVEEERRTKRKYSSSFIT
tara:strand:+ start:199 stop:450 length:252 start_codon:yes stop_codon:yes gene_type:complete